MNCGGHVDLHTDIQISELGLNADTGNSSRYTCVVGSGCDRDPGPDLEIGALAIRGADARILQGSGYHYPLKKGHRVCLQEW